MAAVSEKWHRNWASKNTSKMRHDILADALSAIKNSEAVGKKEVTVPASNVVKEVLRIAQQAAYIGQYEFIDDGKSGKIKVSLIGQITNCGAIRPRYTTSVSELPKWEMRYLPSRDFGIIMISTPKGIMSHAEAKKKGAGGTLVSYMY